MRYGGSKPNTITVPLEVRPAALPQVVFSEEALRWRVENMNVAEGTRAELLRQLVAQRAQLLAAGETIQEEATFRLWGWAEEEQARETCLDRVAAPGAWGGETVRQLNAYRWRALRFRRLLTQWTVEVARPDGTVVPLATEPVPDVPGATQLTGEYFNFITILPELGPLIDGFLMELDRALEGRAGGLGE